MSCAELHDYVQGVDLHRLLLTTPHLKKEKAEAELLTSLSNLLQALGTSYRARLTILRSCSSKDVLTISGHFSSLVIFLVALHGLLAVLRQ